MAYETEGAMRVIWRTYGKRLEFETGHAIMQRVRQHPALIDAPRAIRLGHEASGSPRRPSGLFLGQARPYRMGLSCLGRNQSTRI